MPATTTPALDKLMTEIRSCSLCDGLPLGPKPLFQLSPNARILVVGQAPGRITHHKGIPFDDPSGVRLRDWMGIDRKTFYEDDRMGIFPMGLCYPGTAKGGDHPPRVECAPAWRQRVLSLLTGVELTVVIGRYAIDWHFPEKKRWPVTDVVREWPQLLPKAITLPHPSPRNNRWLTNNPWFEKDAVPQLRKRVQQILQI